MRIRPRVSRLRIGLRRPEIQSFTKQVNKFFLLLYFKKKIEAKYVNDSYLNTNKMTYLDKLHETFFLLEE